MEKLEQHYQKQQQFVSNASHELKTPITVIESYAKLLLRRGFDNKEVAQESLQAIVNESAHMHEMVLQLLDLAKNKEQLAVHYVQLELNPLLKKRLRHKCNKRIIAHLLLIQRCPNIFIVMRK